MSEDPTTPAGPPVPEGPDQAPAETPAPVPDCAECGAALTADQTYCLECGTPTPRAPRLHGGRGRAGMAAALAIVVLGAGAAAAAYAVMADDDGGTPPATTAVVATVVDPTTTAPLPPVLTVPTDVGTGPLPPDTTGVPVLPPVDTNPTVTGDFPVVTEQPGDTGPGAPPVPVDPPPPVDPVDPLDPVTPVDPIDPIDPGPPADPGFGGESDWPLGSSAWTAVVSSVRDESEARDTAGALAATGEESGVLFSSDHAGLRPGYWVVFSGSFTSREAATAHALSLRGQYPGSYPRFIEG
ncbi:MAG: SPOR domain-containing protein [Miltoncostaeaceae bacterium]